MPLLRGLKMRLFDIYVGTNLTTLVSNDYQRQFDLDALGNTFPATNVPCFVRNGYVHALEDEDCIVGLAKSSPNTLTTKNGHLYDFAIYRATNCVLFDSSRSSSGHLKDETNDSLLMPNEDGEFTISFWVNPYSAPNGVYDILSKPILGLPANRFLIRYDSTGVYPVFSFSAATADGSLDVTAEARAIPGRWSLVIARCKRSSVSLDVYGADGFVSDAKTASSSSLGCSFAGGNLYCGIGRDGISNPLHAGSFYLQQVLFWDKTISNSEEKELFSQGRGKVHFSDTAVPETFRQRNLASTNYGSNDGFGSSPNVDIDSSGKITRVYANHSMESPYIPCKACDTEPFCFYGAMTDPSPDEITLSVSWSAASPGCIPTETSFTLARMPRQIIQGFIFGRTFESEKITLPCGGYVKFFLESTPYHWSLYKYRQYLGVETSFGGTVSIAKYAVTMGAALVRNSVNGGSNRFTSPSPAGVSFNFPFTDSFDDYANDIVSSGWCNVASSVLYEQFSPETCTANSIDAACVVADGYRFGVGVDLPENRGGDCGWQLGISEILPGPQTQDSMYNYRVTCGSPSFSNATSVAPSLSELHRPFSAIAYGLIGIHDTKGKLVDNNLPFTGFSATLTPVSFVRPEPFETFNRDAIRSVGPGGCIDCEIEATFESSYRVTTAKISQSTSPQKTLSVTAPVILSGASSGRNLPGYGLLSILGSPASTPSTVSSSGTFYDNNGSESQWLLTLGGTIKPGGEMQFSSQVNNFPGDTGNYGYLLENLKDRRNLNWNAAEDVTPTISRGTKVNPYIFSLPGMAPVGEESGNTIPVTDSQIRRIKPDRGSTATGRGLFPGTETIVSSECDDCHPGCPLSNVYAGVDGIQYAAGILDYSDPLTQYPTYQAAAAPPSEIGPSYGNGSQLVIDCDGRMAGLEDNAAVNDGPRRVFITQDVSGEDVVQFAIPQVTAHITGIKITNECPYLVAKIQYSVFNTSVVNSVVRHYGWDIIHYTRSIGGGMVEEVDARDSYYASHSAGCEYEYAFYEHLPFNDPPLSPGHYPVLAYDPVIEKACELAPFDCGHFVSPTNRIDGTVISPPVTPSPFDAETHFESVLTCGFRNIKFLYGTVEHREAVFRIENTDTCLRPYTPGEPKTVTLNFFEDRQVGFREAPGGRMIEGTNDLDTSFTMSRYMLVTEFGENPAISSCACIDPPFDAPTFNAYDPTPPTYDFSSSTVTLELITPEMHQVGYSEDYSFTIPDSFSSQYAGDRVLTAEDGEMNWVCVTDSEVPVFSILRSDSWTLEIYTQDNESSLCRRIAARYRLSGFPYSRWNRDGDNQMMLVSADWSIGRWPVFLTVEPVV